MVNVCLSGDDFQWPSYDLIMGGRGDENWIFDYWKYKLRIIGQFIYEIHTTKKVNRVNLGLRSYVPKLINQFGFCHFI